MGKALYFITVLIHFIFLNASGQDAFHKKLQSIYRQTVPLISSEKLNDLIAKKACLLILDTRNKEEYDVSHITGALHLNYRSFNLRSLDTLDRRHSIVVYCSIGYRSERIGEKLQAMGFKDVRNLYGGIFEWVNTGNPIIDETSNPTMQVHTYNKYWSQWLLKGVKIF